MTRPSFALASAQMTAVGQAEAQRLSVQPVGQTSVALNLQETATHLIRLAEQMLGPGTGPEKKQAVMVGLKAMFLGLAGKIDLKSYLVTVARPWWLPAFLWNLLLDMAVARATPEMIWESFVAPWIGSFVDYAVQFVVPTPPPPAPPAGLGSMGSLPV